jgi:hypothetical protein
MLFVTHQQIHRFFDAPVGAVGNALLNWKGAPLHELSAYAHSYRTAAMSLVSMQEQRVHSALDERALPILFLYRHALELYLKAIVLKAALLTIGEEELPNALPKLWREHRLTALARMAEPVISASTRWPLTWNGDLKELINSMAVQIDEIDPGSYAFRYPVNTQGAAALPAVFMTNIFQFSEEVERTLDHVAQFCRVLESERMDSSEQMKLALHTLSGKQKNDEKSKAAL